MTAFFELECYKYYDVCNKILHCEAEKKEPVFFCMHLF